MDVPRATSAAVIVEQASRAKPALANAFAAVLGSNGELILACGGGRSDVEGGGRQRALATPARTQRPSSGPGRPRRGRGRLAARRGETRRGGRAPPRRGGRRRRTAPRFPSSAYQSAPPPQGSVPGPVPLTPSAASTRRRRRGERRPALPAIPLPVRPPSSRAASPLSRPAGRRGRARSLRRCARGTGVVVGGDCMEHLGEHRRLQAVRPLLDQAKARWTWPRSRPSAVGRKSGPRSSSRVRPASCRSRREQEVGPQALVELCGLAAEATPTVCSSRPPGQAWWPSWVAGRIRSRPRKSPSPTKASTVRAARDGRSRPPGTRRTVQLIDVRRGSGTSSAGSASRARASAPRAGGGRGSARRGRGRALRPPRRSACRAARRRSRRGPRSCRGIDQLEREIRAPERVRSRCLRATA